MACGQYANAGRPLLRFIPTPPWQHVLPRAREVCFGALWVRLIPSAAGLSWWRLSHPGGLPLESRTPPVGRIAPTSRGEPQTKTLSNKDRRRIE